MSDDQPTQRAARYARWLHAHHRLALLAALIVAVVSAWASTGLRVKADFSNLLPPDAPSVAAMNRIADRIKVFGSLFVVVDAPDRATQERVTAEIMPLLEGIGGGLVANVTADDGPVRRFAWEHRYLLTPLADLEEARDALEERVKKKKLEANPLYIDLDDEDEGASAEDEAGARLKTLRKKLDDLEREANDPSGSLSEDGRLIAITVRATFPAGDVSKSAKLVDAAEAIVAKLAPHYPGVDFGVTGNVRTTLSEHRSILRGMLLAAVVTIAIVWLALLLYYRSFLAVLSALWALTVGSLIAFAVTWAAIGHLNLATAFLAAIVVGNGINPNLILLARYFEERRAGLDIVPALGRAIAGAARGTLGAALTAGVAYASLMVTDFRGFRHFGFIGALGMVACWLTAFTVLPAALAWLGPRVRVHREPAIGRWIAALMPAHLGRMAIAGTLVAVVSAALTWHYVASDPIEEDWAKLRSRDRETETARRWNHRIGHETRNAPNQNLSGRFMIGADSRESAQAVATALKVANALDPEQPLLRSVRTWTDLVPDDQPEKLAVLARIRTLIDEVLPELEGDDLQTARRVRPPENLEAIVDDDVPHELSWMFTENDGSKGRVVFAVYGPGFRSWNVRDLVQFAGRVRSIDLPDDAIIAGQAFIFADMLQSMERDGPIATLVALLGSMLAVWIVIGRRRFGAVTFACAISGTLGMIALVSLFGVKVNFLDFIALPITVGIGLDYAVNIVAREREDGDKGARYVLTTSGGAVFLCSFTTAVGYGSLLLSDNAGIRSFGLAAILGEIACVAFAVFLAPALLGYFRQREGKRHRPAMTAGSKAGT